MWASGAFRARRRRALEAMVATATRSGEFTAPWRSAPDVLDQFRDESEILRELQREWTTTLAGAVYVAIADGDGDLQADVLTALRTVLARHHGVRRILEAHRDHPAIAAAMRKEHALLSCFVEAGTEQPAA